ncbi:MAG: hypothetical protein IJB26_03670 [Clostridia bacterium]|nr:hypothetical protein [Clostridia bacterium]
MFIYEMHQHTARCSACAAADERKTVRALKAAGFAGMVLTNHFYHGNTAVRRSQPWEDFVRAFEQAYLIAKKEGDRLDFDVLFGIEEGVGGGKEVLLYGITPQFLYDHPELRHAELEEITALVHEAGGLVFQAHPFRVRNYIARPWEELSADALDGVETYNAFNSDMENMRAAAFADREGLLCVAGTDSHDEREAVRYGIVVPQRIRTERELAHVLRGGDYTLYIPE